MFEKMNLKIALTKVLKLLDRWFPVILVLLVLLWSPTVMAVHFLDPSETAHFRPELPISLDLFTADLVFEIDLNRMRVALNTTCQAMEKIWPDLKEEVCLAFSVFTFSLPFLFSFWTYTYFSFLLQAIRHLYSICEEELLSWDLIVDMLTGSIVISTRRARFVATLLLSALAAGIGGYVLGSSHSPSESEEVLMANENHLVTALRATQSRVSLNSRSLMSIQDVLHSVQARQLLQGDHIQAGLIMVAAMLAQTQAMGRILQGLETLIVHGKLSPLLLSPNVLKGKLDKLQAKARKMKKQLAISSELELFECPVSYTTFSNYVMRVVVHIPTRYQADVYRVFSYIPVPFGVNSTFYTTKPEQLLAVSKNNKYHFELPKAQLLDCKRFKSFYSCQSISVLHRQLSESCLWGLYNNNSSMVLRNCKLFTAPSVPSAYRLSAYEFSFFHPVKSTVSVKCNKTSSLEKHAFRGVRSVRLPPNCIASNSHELVMTPSHILSDEIVIKLDTVTVYADDLVFSSPPLDNATARVVHDPEFPEIEVAQIHSSIPWDTVILASVLTALVAFVLIVAIWHRATIFNCCKRQNNSSG